jgi:hypothetical protein
MLPTVIAASGGVGAAGSVGLMHANVAAVTGGATRRQVFVRWHALGLGWARVPCASATRRMKRQANEGA